MLALARSGVAEGVWLRAERQSSGRGRMGREWSSPVGNFYGSTVVRLRPRDPAPATLALLAAVALEEAVSTFLPFPGEGRGPGGKAVVTTRAVRQVPTSQLDPGLRRGTGQGGVRLKWPNDLLVDGAKLSGILLERTDDAVIVGIGVNLAHHPDLPDRPTTSLAAHAAPVAPAQFAETLAETFARWLSRWRGEGLAPVRQRWLDRAHPIGTALTARLPDGTAHDGLFDGLDADGALILRLADGGRRVIHAADVFLI
ncbi:biotin--[acetyl-CoA-carboxylase] ligase [Sphingomonas ginsenosidivorax]|uniref:biotin--[biotin carboxyl-carrier protein] ligase n=1 Tax=Sphingomonas ginsenosidivorax TaxID=862135 RepID=A0A5C6UFI3_9SPHN|nr:biotin--[acetyl-CoA-carboxylase] ligase [Sphingomonas ginsenosidivorax]TXC71543.1 biotin--[acetyl-CoA-carboxylase] ligase [Sphingomonas ginsenosidivorax]